MHPLHLHVHTLCVDACSARKPAWLLRWSSQPPRFGAKLRHAVTRTARRPRRTRGCSSSPRASTAICARAPPASTVGDRADCRRHFMGGEPGKPGRSPKRDSETVRIPIFPWARHWQSSRARQSSTQSMRFGASGVPSPLHCALAQSHHFGCAQVVRPCRDGP